MEGRWSEEEDAIIRSRFDKCEYSVLASLLGRSTPAVRNRVYRLGLSGRIRWSREDIEKLRAHYEAAGDGHLNLDDFAASIGRNKVSCSILARKLGFGTSRHRSKSPELKAMNAVNMKAQIAKQGHPKGMLGKSHSAKTKSDIGRISRARWASYTDAEKQSVLDKSYRARVKTGTLGPGKTGGRGSWKAGWHVIAGRRIYFRSSWEVNYCRYLQFLKRRGDISDWEYEPETFWFEAIRRGVRSYKPDFRVTLNDGKKEWHEVKGWMDSRSRTTLKRMKKYYPNEVVKVIDTAAYNSIKNAMSCIVPGWE